jgi:hypothetical protein
VWLLNGSFFVLLWPTGRSLIQIRGYSSAIIIWRWVRDWGVEGGGAAGECCGYILEYGGDDEMRLLMRDNEFVVVS